MNPNFGHVMSPVSHKLNKLQSMNYEESYEKVSILQAIWFLRRKINILNTLQYPLFFIICPPFEGGQALNFNKHESPFN